MATLARDPIFVRDCRSLADWLPQLADDARRACGAAAAIEHMAPRIAGRGPTVVARRSRPIGGWSAVGG